MGDAHRLKIVAALRYGELTVGDIAEVFEAEVVTVSHHQKIIGYANLVEVRRDGRFMYYRLHEDLRCSKGKRTRFLALDSVATKFRIPDSLRIAVHTVASA